MQIRTLLASIASLITGKPRAFPVIKWHKELWSYNTFRAFEYLFGRECNEDGNTFSIRKEASVRDYFLNGKRVTERRFFTWEAFFVHMEATVRAEIKALLGNYKDVRWKYRYPALVYKMGAIALDTYISTGNSDSTGTDQTIAYTVTGSDPFLYVGNLGETGGVDNISGVTYNSVAMSNQNSQRIPSGRWTKDWTLGNPSTGSNNIVATKTNNTYSETYAVSYSGAQSSSTPDSKNQNTTAASSPVSVATTVVASNCWLVGFGGCGTASAITSNRTNRYNAPNLLTFDSNGVVATGSQSTTLTATDLADTGMSAMVVSFAPASAPVAVSINRNFMSLGVGQ